MGFCAAHRDLRRGVIGRFARMFALQRLLRLVGSPGFRSHAAQRQSDVSNGSLLNVQRSGHRNERKRIGGPVAHFEVVRPGRERQRRQGDRRDQFAMSSAVSRSGWSAGSR